MLMLLRPCCLSPRLYGRVLLAFCATLQMSLWDLRKGKLAFTFAPKDADRKGEAGRRPRTLIPACFRRLSIPHASFCRMRVRAFSVSALCSVLLYFPPLLTAPYPSLLWGLVGHDRHGDVRAPAGRIPLVREPVRGDGARQRAPLRV